MKNLRKTLSIILAISILATVCAVSFGGITNAYTVNGEAGEFGKTYTYNFINDETGESCYIANHKTFGNSERSDYKSVILAGGGMKLFCRPGSYADMFNYQANAGFGQWTALIKDTDVNLGNTHGWLQIEADTDYEVKVYFKKDSETVTDDMTFGAAIGITSDQGVSNYDAVSNEIKNDLWGSVAITDDGAYKLGIAGTDTSTHVISATIHGNGTSPRKIKKSDTNIIQDPSAIEDYTPNVGKYIVIKPHALTSAGAVANGAIIVEKVEVTVKDGSDYVYVPYTTDTYNFVKDDTMASSYAGIAANKWLSRDEESRPIEYRSYVDTTNGGLFLGNEYTAVPSSANNILNKTPDGWGHFRAYIRDLDIDNGEWLRVSAGTSYGIVVKFKGGNGLANGNTYGLGISLSTAANMSGNPLTSTIQETLSYKSHIPYTNNDGYSYIAAIIDGDAQYHTTWDATNEKWNMAAAAGRYITIDSESNVNASIYIESVIVYTIKNSDSDKLVLTQEADGSFSVATAAKDSAIPGIDLTAKNAYGESPISTGVPAVVVGVDKEVTAVENNMLIVSKQLKYPTATMDFADDVFNPNNIPEYSIVDSGDAAHGKVLQFDEGASTGGYDINIRQQKVEAGKTYYLSMDVKRNDNDAKFGGFSYYLASEAGIGVAGNKTALGSCGKITINNLKEGSDWQRVGMIFECTNVPEGQEYLIFRVSASTAKTGSIWFDNVNLTVFDNVDDVANAENDVVAAKGSIRKASGEGSEYVSAGLRFNATMSYSALGDVEDLGFVLLPTQLADSYAGEGKWFEAENWAASGAKTASAKGKLYANQGDALQYQLILTGLSTEDGKTAYKMNFTTKMYVLKDGVYTYYDVSTSSYNEVKAAYRVYGLGGDNVDAWMQY